MQKITKTLFALLFITSLQTCIAQPTPPCTSIIHHIPAETKTYIGSPSITKLNNNHYLATCDHFGPNSNEFTSPTTKLFISKDKGLSWQPLTEIKNIFWATIFTHKDNVYLFGTSKHNGSAVILRSKDNGRSWTTPKDKTTGLLLQGSYHCAPVPVLFHNSKIYRAMEDTYGPKKGLSHLRPFMLSADINSDLLNASSWTKTNSIDINPNWLNCQFKGFLEGNAVQTPDNKIVDILRVDTPKGNKAAIVNISPDCKTATFNPQKNMIDFPGGAKKFTIRFDPISKKYYSLVNYTYPGYLQKNKAADIRNTLALTYSTDLINWKINSIIIFTPNTNYAFQYVDWIFDCNDIIAVSRTAYSDNHQGPHSFHDANYLTFHRIKNFRNFGRWNLTEDITPEKQITFDNKNHELDNNDNFSPDSKWLCYDTRKAVSGIGQNPTIEKVNIETGEIKTIYSCPDQTQYGPGTGAAGYCPTENKIIFIHGLKNCNKNHPYDFSRRTGVMIDESNPTQPIFVDARDVTYPFTPGALRGGTHRHQFSADGKWIGYTYNDDLLAKIEKKTGEKVDLRTIAVSTSTLPPVTVDKDLNGENNDGQWFSAVVVKVTPTPTPSSDQISKAHGDTWVGTKGYQKPDGTYQRSRVFLGICRDHNNKELTEAFIVDIPDRIDIPSDQGPLQGTRTQMPFPPKDARQKRITYTEQKKHPGIISVTSSFDARYIAFVACDDNKIKQAFITDPSGTSITQLTHHKTDIQSNLRFNPNAPQFCYVCDNSIFIYDIETANAVRKTKKTTDTPFALVYSGNGRIIAYNRKIKNGESKFDQIFTLTVK